MKKRMAVCVGVVLAAVALTACSGLPPGVKSGDPAGNEYTPPSAPTPVMTAPTNADEWLRMPFDVAQGPIERVGDVNYSRVTVTSPDGVIEYCLLRTGYQVGSLTCGLQGPTLAEQYGIGVASVEVVP